MAKKLAFNDRVTLYLAELAQLQKKHRIAVELSVMFATHRRTPILSQIALMVLSLQGGKIGEKFTKK